MARAGARLRFPPGWRAGAGLFVFSQPVEEAMSNENPNSPTRIQELNDAFRRSFVGGVVVITAGL